MLKANLTVTEEKVGVVDAEGIVAADVDLDSTVVVKQLQDRNLGRDQLHPSGQEASAVSPKTIQFKKNELKSRFFLVCKC